MAEVNVCLALHEQTMNRRTLTPSIIKGHARSTDIKKLNERREMTAWGLEVSGDGMYEEHNKNFD